MTFYIYLKAPVKQKSKRKEKTFLQIKKFFPYLSVVSGITLLLMIIFPLISYQLLVFSKKRNKPISPLAEYNIASARQKVKAITPSVLSAQDNNQQPEIQSEVDYSLIENWFPSVTLPRLKPTKITHYLISIPKLKIKDAIVSLNKTKIKKTLIHYPGTALPGEHGNTVIFGHSVLPMFYNPKNYKTIFSTLPTLEKGDKIYVYFDGIEYLYQVEGYSEVKPDEVQVLEQRFNEQVLTLITCVPPGTYLRRGVIKARLIDI